MNHGATYNHNGSEVLMSTTTRTKQALPLSRGGGTNFVADPEQIVIVGIDEPFALNGDPEHDLAIRTHPHYDPRITLPIRETMVADIQAIGVREAIIVAYDGEHMFAVSGRQRLRHCREANRQLRERGEPTHQVKVVRANDDEETIALVAVSLNEHRVDDDLLVRAHKAATLVNRNIAVARVAVSFAVTPQTIRDWCQIDSLDEATKARIRSGELTASAARALVGLTPAQRAEAIDELITSPEKPTKARAAKVAEAVRTSKPARPKLASSGLKLNKRQLRAVVSGAAPVSDDLSAHTQGALLGIRIALGEVEDLDLLPDDLRQILADLKFIGGAELGDGGGAGGEADAAPLAVVADVGAVVAEYDAASRVSDVRGEVEPVDVPAEADVDAVAAALYGSTTPGGGDELTYERDDDPFSAFASTLPEMERTFLRLLRERGTMTISEVMAAMDASAKVVTAMVSRIAQAAGRKQLLLPYTSSVVNGERGWAMRPD